MQAYVDWVRSGLTLKLGDADGAFALLHRSVSGFEETGDLYGQAASVGFVERIRSEERFDSVEALVAAMHRDVEAARRVLEPR